MSHDQPGFDVAKAHIHFAVECFNHAWTFIEKPIRTPAEDEAMVLCSLASLWHWTQRKDCTDLNLSIGHWQVSRAWALAGNGPNSMHHALRSLKLADGAGSFYVGYSHEAIARAALVLKDAAAFRQHLDKARSHAARVKEADERGSLEKDLLELEAAGQKI
jgi:hypothetical protein